MADTQTEQTQAPQDQDPIMLAKARAAERIKALFHKEKEADMNNEKAVQRFLKLKSLEKQRFDKSKQLEELKRRVWHIAPRPTLERMLQEAS